MLEARLIDAIELVRYLCGACPNHQNGECIDKMCWKYEDRARIENAPTIEAEPVRHGRMIEGRYPNENKCSECGKMFRDDIGFIIQDDYGVFHNPARCPECGCYWDGGADNG